jgi:hypothetical protein
VVSYGQKPRETNSETAGNVTGFQQFPQSVGFLRFPNSRNYLKPNRKPPTTLPVSLQFPHRVSFWQFQTLLKLLETWVCNNTRRLGKPLNILQVSSLFSILCFKCDLGRLSIFISVYTNVKVSNLLLHRSSTSRHLSPIIRRLLLFSSYSYVLNTAGTALLACLLKIWPHPESNEHQAQHGCVFEKYSELASAERDCERPR